MAAESLASILPALDRMGVHPEGEQRRRLEKFVALLLRWNGGINLIGDPDRVWSRHILDGLMVLALPWPEEAREAIDLGSGGGLPAVPLAIMAPWVRVTAAERMGKKATFLQVAGGAVGLENLSTRRDDVDAMAADPAWQARFDVVTARAYADLAEVLRLGGALLRPGGEVRALKGRRLAEEQAALPAEVAEQFDPDSRAVRYDFPEFGTGGVLAVYRKRSD